MTAPEKMRLLLLGSGGREHALAWKLSQSPCVESIVVIPGNAGTRQLAKTKNMVAAEPNDIRRIAKKENVSLAVFADESDLHSGVVDSFSTGISCIGPNSRATALEASKVLAKGFMGRHGIPTAKYWAFEDPVDARFFLHYSFAEGACRLVLKKQGLTGSRDVFIVGCMEDAENALEKIFAEAAACHPRRSGVMIEQYLAGPEFSVLVLMDGSDVLTFPPYVDFRQRKESNQGPFTGGMGCVLPTSRCPGHMLERIEQGIIQRTIKGMRQEGLEFSGFLCLGIIVTGEGPKLVEYDVRLGDPETQALVTFLHPMQDLARVLMDYSMGRLGSKALSFPKLYATVVVAVTEDYPDHVSVNRKIRVQGPLGNNSHIFHSHTFTEAGGDQGIPTLVHARGGRVLSVCGVGDTPEEANHRAYRGMERIAFNGMDYRRNICEPLEPNVY
ncbi:hypothetical protein LCI18_000970 [Fusarium solani-melongenae]|uniref:Uncharacterized protein n=1 Tax=Fusarium solani subsp. cucurbitae TaxID=2747967 RepID=A0ACD3YM73_FUSSC|nr:hypothetical protein LCI18_000970 [Fusarium solani-melongenae]